MIKEFKEFISRGNVLDLAVAVVIGTAFKAIVTSLVNDVLMPIIGMILGGLDFSNLALTVGDATITYGMFIQNIIDFVIIAFSVFMIVKLVNKFNKKEEEAEEEPTPEVKAEDVVLLEEIRDLLKKDVKTAKKTSKKKKIDKK